MFFVLQTAPPYGLHCRSIKLGSALAVSTQQQSQNPNQPTILYRASLGPQNEPRLLLASMLPVSMGDGHTPVHFHLTDPDSGYECPAGLWGFLCAGEPWSPWRTDSDAKTVVSSTPVIRSFTAPWLISTARLSQAQ